MLIVFEGVDGSGKTTQADLFAEYLSKCGYDVLRTREPGGCPSSEMIRSLVKDKTVELSNESIFFMLLAARIEHTNKVIRPALLAGKVVICDRFIMSSQVLQSYVAGFDIELMDMLHKRFVTNVTPSLTFVLDLAPEIAYQRKHNDYDRFDSMDLSFYERSRNGYLHYADSKRVKVFDASQSINAVHDDVVKGFAEYLDDTLTPNSRRNKRLPSVANV